MFVDVSLVFFGTGASSHTHTNAGAKTKVFALVSRSSLTSWQRLLGMNSQVPNDPMFIKSAFSVMLVMFALVWHS